MKHPTATVYIPVTLTLEERTVLLEEGITDRSSVLELIETAPIDGRHCRVMMSPGDLENLLEMITRAADSAAAGPRQELLQNLFQRLAAFYAEHRPNQQADGADVLDVDIDEFVHELEAIMEKVGVEGIEEVKAAFEELIGEVHDAPMPDLGGLTGHQVFELIEHGWWAAPGPVRLNEHLPMDALETSSFLVNARTLLHALEESGGTPATGKGNLNRKFVALMVERMRWPREFVEALHRYNKVIDEQDVRPLHLIRVVCYVAGLLRKYKKRWVVTKQGKALLGESEAGTLYARLFNVFFKQFNLSYLDRISETPGLQATVPYSLAMIGRLPGEEYHEIQGLPPLVLLPPVIEEFNDDPASYGDVEWLLTSRILGPLESFGLVEMKRQREGTFGGSETHVKKTPLFDQFLHFDL